jgi:aryl-alcohol dehydrogenase (NADP+)
MEYVRLGSTGLQVSRVCLGCMSFGQPDQGTHPWSLNEEQSRPLIRQALDSGINFFDTANVYSAGSSEEITGKVLGELLTGTRWSSPPSSTAGCGPARTAPACPARQS